MEKDRVGTAKEILEKAKQKGIALHLPVDHLLTREISATAQTQARVTRGAYADFDSLVQAGYLDQRFAGSNPNLRGYRFSMIASENEFVVNADPQVQTGPATGSRHFYLDSTENAIHVNSSQPATKQDPLL